MTEPDLHGAAGATDAAGAVSAAGAADAASAASATGATGAANAAETAAAVDAAESPESIQDPQIARAKRILKGLGFCGHYMHFHGGGRSGQIPILCMLDRCDGTLSQQELGMRFELKPGSLSEILSKMETAGLIERTRDTKDRRQLFVHLTEAGQELAQREHDKREAFRRAAFTALTVEEQEQLADMLEKIRVTWEEIDG